MIKKSLFVLAATLFLLVLIEGLVSWGLFVHDLLVHSEPPLAARQHTDFDSRLGWIPRPESYVADLYGPGRSVTLDARGFRRAGSSSDDEGRKIIICSGDSFTFGYGVDDTETWVHRLETMEPHWKTINMGQGGYGLDQAYLWYCRDGLDLDHDVHLFAVIQDDFRRMQYDRFLGYGKPTLALIEGRLEAVSVPVEEQAFRWPWWTQNRRLVGTLRSMQLLSRSSALEASSPIMETEEVKGLALAAMKDLQARHREAGRAFAFVWLPTREDARPSSGRDAIRRDFIGALRGEGIIAIDLIDVVRGAPPNELDEWFIAPGALEYRGAEGHYTALGNQKIAEALHQQLGAISLLAKALAR